MVVKLYDRVCVGRLWSYHEPVTSQRDHRVCLQEVCLLESNGYLRTGVINIYPRSWMAICT